MKYRIVLLAFSLFIFINCTFSQEITGSNIIQNMKYKFGEVKDYTVDIEANLNMEKVRMPKIKIKMYYKNPDKFHYESKSFALLPKGGINFNPLSYDEEKCEFNLKGKENLNGTDTYVVEVIKKKPEKKSKDQKQKQQPKDQIPEKSIIWVDAERWVAKKITSEPNEKRSLTILFSHSYIDNKYYMPSKVEVEYDVPDMPEGQPAPDMPNPKRGSQKNPRKGSVVVNFNNYVINSGLSDDIFKEEKKKN